MLGSKIRPNLLKCHDTNGVQPPHACSSLHFRLSLTCKNSTKQETNSPSRTPVFIFIISSSSSSRLVSVVTISSHSMGGYPESLRKGSGGLSCHGCVWTSSLRSSSRLVSLFPVQGVVHTWAGWFVGFLQVEFQSLMTSGSKPETQHIKTVTHKTSKEGTEDACPRATGARTAAINSLTSWSCVHTCQSYAFVPLISTGKNVLQGFTGQATPTKHRGGVACPE